VTFGTGGERRAQRSLVAYEDMGSGAPGHSSARPAREEGWTMKTPLRAALATLAAVLLLPLPGAAVSASSRGAETPRASAYAGTWHATTGQDKAMTFKVNSRGRVTYLRVAWVAGGGGCEIGATSTLRSLSAPINAHKRFRVQSQMGNTSLLVKGHMVTKAKATGSLRVTVVDTTGYGCSGTAQTSWTAHKGA
jgi:hypothetical protein